MKLDWLNKNDNCEFAITFCTLSDCLFVTSLNYNDIAQVLCLSTNNTSLNYLTNNTHFNYSSVDTAVIMAVCTELNGEFSVRLMSD